MFCSPIKVRVENAANYSFATIDLHNYLQQTHNAYYCPTGFLKILIVH